MIIAASRPCNSGEVVSSTMASSAIRTTTGDAFSKRKYDYIIIGGGTAGLVVASRLTDNSDISVGVIEAGHVTAANEALLRVPGHGGRAAGSECDWKFETVPQVGLAGRKLQWPRGKILGGTSAMNLLVWNWAAREDYDTWEELGNAGWNHQSLR